MKLIDKLKTVKKRWIYLSIVLIAVIILGGIATAVVHERFDRGDGDHRSQVYQAYYDLLSIENTDNLKLSSGQAKAILPLIEQLNKTSEEKAQTDILKNIYSNLTYQQYYSLLTDNKANESVGKGWRGKENRRAEFKGEHGESKVSNSALEAVVAKMLKDVSAQ